MPNTAGSSQTPTKQEIIDRIRAIVPSFRNRAEATEEARRIPEQSVQELLDAGVARNSDPAPFRRVRARPRHLV